MTFNVEVQTCSRHNPFGKATMTHAGVLLQAGPDTECDTTTCRCQAGRLHYKRWRRVHGATLPAGLLITLGSPRASEARLKLDNLDGCGTAPPHERHQH